MKRILHLNILSVIMFLSGLAGTIWFLLPFTMHGILNIGNITGIVFCAAIMIYGCFTHRINTFLKNFRKRAVGRVITGAAGLCLVIMILLVITETVFMVKAAVKEPEPDSTLIILGCQVKGERPSLMLRKRLEAAYEYLAENPDSACILSGGQGPDEAISEAECMYRYLTEKGISPDRLYKEEKSTSTRENLAFSKEILEDNHLNPNIAIATNEFHQYRAGRIADALGFDYAAVSGRTPLYLLASYYVRELYGILYEWVF